MRHASDLRSVRGRGEGGGNGSGGIAVDESRKETADRVVAIYLSFYPSAQPVSVPMLQSYHRGVSYVA